MDSYGLPGSPVGEVFKFPANSASAGANWYTWIKPTNKTYASITAIGGGGGGGAGFIGAINAAGGGGGGGSGAVTVVTIPLALLPPQLFISVGFAQAGAGIASYVSVQPTTAFAGEIVAIAPGGGLGGTGTSSAGGAAGAGGTAGTAATMTYGWTFTNNDLITFTSSAVAGNAGTIGGFNANGGNHALATTGIRVTGGGAGSGLQTAGGTGGNVGGGTYSFTLPGGTAAGSTTTPPGVGQNGVEIGTIMGQMYYLGGTGGGSTSGTATGAGLVQAAGGNGAIGCGGGGSGGALTGSSAATASKGGPGLVWIVCY